MGNSSPVGSLGEARGTLGMDIAPMLRELARAVQVAGAAGKQIEQAFGGIDRGTKKAEKGIGGLGASLQNLGGAFGLAFGARQIAQYLTGVNDLSTAYTRQNVAALSLAGSQEKLNTLLLSYDKVTGSAIGKAQSLAAVTQLQAIGFADSTAELERFVTAARGISLATRRPQEFVQQQLQFELSNQTGFRLDQIGLDLNEVNNKTKELRAANSSLSQSMAYQNAILDLATQKYGKLVRSVEGQATGLEKARKGWADLSLQIGESLGPATGGVMTGLASELNGIQTILQGLTRDANAAGDAIQRMGGGKQSQLPGPMDFLNWDPIGGGVNWLNNQLGLNQPPGGGRRITASGFGGSMPSGMAPEFSFEQMAQQRAAKLDFEESIQDIERSANEQRLDETRSYESQRTQTIASYERTIARDAADFARQRARAEAQFAKQIADVQKDIAKRETEAQEDLAERIADAQSATAKRISDIDENYRRNRERAERTHRDNLMDAAARLDATAVFNEQKRFARESEEAKTAHDEQIGQEQENLAERLQQEQESHAERLQEAREADAERLADMQRDFEEQKRLEDEDRAIRLQRMAEDHAVQLASMATAHAEQMAEIDRQEAEELKSAQEAHLKELEAAGLFNKSWKAIQDAREREALQSWDRFWQEFNGRLRMQGPQTPAQAQSNQWSGIQLADPSTWNFSSAPPSARGGDTRNFNASISVFAAPGQSAESVAGAVRAEMVRVFRELAN